MWRDDFRGFDDVDEREFRATHGHDDREDFSHHSAWDEVGRLGSRKPAALLDTEDEREAA